MRTKLGILFLGSLFALVAISQCSSKKEQAAKNANEKSVQALNYEKEQKAEQDKLQRWNSLTPAQQKAEKLASANKLRQDAIASISDDSAVNGVTLDKMSWYRGGFDSIMIADFTIKNSNPVPIKDITITCTHYAPSGTKIDSNTRTIYESIPTESKKTFKKFSMGFIHSQAAQTSCKLVSVKLK